jgi:hypothetical protein
MNSPVVQCAAAIHDARRKTHFPKGNQNFATIMVCPLFAVKHFVVLSYFAD